MPDNDVFTVAMNNQTIVADATLVIIHTPSTIGSRGSMIEIMRASVSQNETETGQQLGIIVGTKATAFGTYTSTTPASKKPGGPVSGIAGGTAGAAATSGTDASAEGAGTVTPMFYEGFDNRNGWLWIPTGDEQPLILPDTAFIIKMLGTPTTLTGWNAHVVFREVT